MFESMTASLPWLSGRLPRGSSVPREPVLHPAASQPARDAALGRTCLPPPPCCAPPPRDSCCGGQGIEVTGENEEDGVDALYHQSEDEERE